MIPSDSPVAERALWTVRRDLRQATAVLRAGSFGRELRLSIDGELVFRRLLSDSDVEDRIAADLLRVFNRQGWVRMTG
jgi:hypothetical protein